jgi:hypothetical protein
MAGRAPVLCVFGLNTNLDPYKTKKKDRRKTRWGDPALVYRKGRSVCRCCHVDVAKVQDSANRSRETLKKKRRDRISK